MEFLLSDTDKLIALAKTQLARLERVEADQTHRTVVAVGDFEPAPAEGEAEDREALDSAISHNLSPIFGWSQLGHELATPERWRERVQKAIDDILAAGFARRSPVETEENWESVHWNDLTSDDEEGNPIGDTIRLTWGDGTRLVGRLTVASYGAGHHQMARMHTIFGGDTWVWPHGSKLERQARPAGPWLPVTEEKK